MQRLWRLKMQIIKPKLVGLKLWATAPLKCFKMSTNNNSSSSSSSSTNTSTVFTPPLQDPDPAPADDTSEGYTGPSLPDRFGNEPGDDNYDPTQPYIPPTNTGNQPSGPGPSPGGGSKPGETPQERESRLKKEAEERRKNAAQAAKEREKRQAELRKAELKKQQQALDAKREKELQEKTERETDALDDRNFFERIADTLYAGDVAAFGSKQKADILRKRYDDTRKKQGVEEARRLGRPVIIDGKLYKPGMQTPEEAEEERQMAADFGISVDQLRKEFDEEGSLEEKVQQKQRQIREEELAASKGFDSVEEMRDAEFEQSQFGQDPRFGSVEEFQSFKESQRKRPAVGERDPFSVTGAMELNPFVQQQNRRRLRQDLINYERGVYSADDFRKDYGQEPPDVLTRNQLIEGLGYAGSLLSPAAIPASQLASFISSKVSDPATALEAEESLAQDAQDQAEADAAAAVDPRDEEPQEVTPPRPGGGDPVQRQVDYLVPIEPADPDAPTEDELGDQLVKREARRLREQTLAMQISQIRALPISAGQKQLMLRRMQERFDLKFGPQVQTALLKERQDRRDRAEGKEVKSDPETGQPLWLTSLNAFVAGLPIIDQLGKKFKLFEEGGFVSGPGTETSDSIPARLSDGEFVIRASAVRGLGKAMGANGKEEERAKGVDFLYKLQDKMDKVEKFQNGGQVREEPKMRNKLIGPLRMDMMGPSAMTDKERSQVTDLKGDPRDVKESKKRSLQILMNELGKRNKGMLGKEPGVSKQKVQALLERKNREIAEKDQLINKLMQGAKPGKFFDKPRLPMAKGGEAYARPKKAFKEAIGYESESRFDDKAAKDAKHGGARRKFRHFQMGGAVDIKPPSMLKDQFKVPSSGGYGSVVAAQGELMRRIEELERRVGK